MPTLPDQSPQTLATSLLAGQCPDVPPWEIASAVDWLLEAMGPFPADDLLAGLRRAAAALNGSRQFAHAQRLASGWRDRAALDPSLARMQAQALIELGSLDLAESLLQETVATRPAAYANTEIPECQGLLARIAKQRFVLTEEPRALASAASLYLERYREHGPQAFWYGINAVALLSRQGDGGWRNLATEVREHCLTRHANDDGDPWLAAALSEACLALGRCDEAELWLYRFLQHERTQPFHVGSLDRQLREIWRGSLVGSGNRCASRLVGIIARHRMRTEGRASFSKQGLDAIQAGGAAARQLEKVFSAEYGFSLATLQRMVSACASIGCVTRRGGERLGTGFLVRGGDIRADWGDRPVFVTNAHVISDEVAGAIPVGEAMVTFEVEAARATVPAFYRVEKLLFTSAPGQLGARNDRHDELDVSIVWLEALGFEAGLPTAAQLPLLGPKAKSYVVGHPLGGGLQVSLHDSLLLDIDDDGRLIHYRTPTEPGSSGSPVFNGQWQVIGIHHGGSSNTPRLRGAGSYEANEGISLAAIRHKLRSLQ